MKVGEILNIIESLYPPAFAQNWDNIGLIVGRKNWSVTGVLVCLDCTEQVVAEAVKTGLNTIVCHHPPIFAPLKTLKPDRHPESALALAIKHDIAIISAHTNLDSAPGGLNHSIAEKLGLTGINFFSPSGMRITQADARKLRFGKSGPPAGAIGTLKTVLPVKRLLDRVKRITANGHIRLAGDSTARVKHVAVCTGAGGDFIEPAKKAGADIFITGETKHHHALLAESIGLILADAGHYPTESIMPEIVADALRRKTGRVAVKKSVVESDPYKWVY